MKTKTLEEVGTYQQKLFNYLSDLGVIALQSEMQEIETIVLEKQKKGYSEEEVLEFTQTIIQQYKFGNTNIEQLDLLKETLQQIKKIRLCIKKKKLLMEFYITEQDLMKILNPIP